MFIRKLRVTFFKSEEMNNEISSLKFKLAIGAYNPWMRYFGFLYQPSKLLELPFMLVFCIFIKYFYRRFYLIYLVSRECLCSVCGNYRELLLRICSKDDTFCVCSKECFLKAETSLNTFSQEAKCDCGNDANELYTTYFQMYEIIISEIRIKYFCSAACEKTDRKKLTKDGTKLLASCICGKIMNSNKKQHKKCGGCEVEFYCSKECQKKDWAEHKKVCKPIS